MKVHEENFTDFLEASNLTYFSQYAAWSNGAHTQSKGETGPMEVVIMIISILQVLLNMLVILVLILNSVIRKMRNKNKNFFFIVNLAGTDIVGFILMVVCLEIQKDSWSYKSSPPDVFSAKISSGCQKQIAILTFSYLNSVFATIFLTVDRFLFIYKSLHYESFMNRVSCLK